MEEKGKMMKEKVTYPVGEQSFEEIRLRGNLYIDKTKFIEKMVDSGSKYIFLGRPRRFGKSLFMSTLKCFFEGKRHLFEGLYIDTVDWDWQEWPVLHFDLNYSSYGEHAQLESVLNNQLSRYEQIYGVEVVESDFSIRFDNLIRAAKKKVGMNVVILIDEYDKPLVYNLHDKERYERMRSTLMDFYSCFKSDGDFIKMAFLTGVSRFSHLSLFTGNNIDDISFDMDFADICGITEQELIDNFQPGIQAIAKEYELTPEEALERLKSYYDGYHFARRCPDIYNPFSLLCAMSKREFGDYWTLSGGLTRLVLKQIKRFNINFHSLVSAICSKSELQGLDFDSPMLVALLYQTGYLTIKSYDRSDDCFTLGIPNNEVKRGFLNFLLPFYATGRETDDIRFSANEFVREIKQGRAASVRDDLPK